MNGETWPPGAWRWCVLLLALGVVGGYCIGAAVTLGQQQRRAHLAAGIEQLLTEVSRDVD